MLIKRVIILLTALLIPTASISAPAASYSPHQYPAPLTVEQYKQPEPSSVALCNCWAFTKQTYHPDLPSMKEVNSNLTQNISDVAVFYYHNSGLYHYAKVTWTDGYNFKIDEANYNHCKRSQRDLNLDYQYLLGFYEVTP